MSAIHRFSCVEFVPIQADAEYAVVFDAELAVHFTYIPKIFSACPRLEPDELSTVEVSKVSLRVGGKHVRWLGSKEYEAEALADAVRTINEMRAAEREPEREIA